MKFLHAFWTVVAAMAALVAFDVRAQNQDEQLPEREASTTIAQADTDAEASGVIDLDDPESTEAPRVPAPDAPAPTDAPATPRVGPSEPSTATSTAAREASSRQTQAVRARQAISEATVLRSNQQLEAAAERLEFALNNLYITGATAADYQRAAYGLAGIRAQQAALEFQEGNFDEAVSLYEKAVLLDPANTSYRQGLASARERQDEATAASRRVDEVDNNPAITPEFAERVKVVRRLFYEYERFMDTGQFDKADDRLKRILALDPYNRTARQLQKKVVDKKYRAASEMRMMTREDAMLKVTERWYENVPPDYGMEEEEGDRVEAELSRLAAMENKLNSIVVPSIDFQRLDIEQVVRFLRDKAFELDETGLPPRGVNFVLDLNTGPALGPDGQPTEQPGFTRSVSLNLANVPLSEVLRFISTITQLQVKVEEYAVVLSPVGRQEFLDTRTYKVPPGFIPPDIATGEAGGDGFTTVESVSVKIQDVLASKGISFDAPGSSAIYLPSVTKIVVTNTPAELDIIDALIRSSMEAEQPQVEIETKFAEFTDDSLKALYFQYYYSASASILSTAVPGMPDSPFAALAPFSYNPAQIYDPGEIANLNGTNAATNQRINMIPGTPSPFGSVRTAGQSALRTAESEGTAGASGFAGLTPNGVDILLRQNSPGTGDAIAAGVQPINWLTGTPLGVNDFNTLAVGGVINGRGFASIVQLIDNLQGVDLLASPKVTTKNRTEATIEIVRELRYPTEFERPEINSEIFIVNFLQPGQEIVFIVLPATPSEFEVEDIGVTLRVTPTTYPDQRIDLELAPEVVDFEGFINYGQPITQILRTDQRVFVEDVILIFEPNPFPPPDEILTDAVDVIVETEDDTIVTGAQVIADGVVNQPVFSVRSINTKLQVLDNQTVVMGGLIREDRQEINDKVPILGDIPVIGRAFTSKVEQSFKRNLMMFVTARLIKSDGTPLYSGELPEEQIDKLEISPGLSPMIAPQPPPRYIRVRRDRAPKQMYDGKMLISAESKEMYEVDGKEMFEPSSSKAMNDAAGKQMFEVDTGDSSVDFDDTTVYPTGEDN
ncbi:MAG: hypothetical protein AAGK14_09730 [Verrucomicrobiota bacterium]